MKKHQDAHRFTHIKDIIVAQKNQEKKKTLCNLYISQAFFPALRRGILWAKGLSFQASRTAKGNTKAREMRA